MKGILKLTALVVLIFLSFFNTGFGKTFPPPDKADDRTLSPYFFVKSDDPNVDQLPLKSTSAAVTISGVIAGVEVTQVYKNEGKRPLEAIYVFPASTRAAVHGMKMTVGKRVIKARISKREDARQEYEKAREQGKSASLLEQQRPNVFQMNVANIMPGDEIKVELQYTELLIPTDRIYGFVYPTVVGPRYSNQSAETASPSEHWVQNPYLRKGEAPASTFDITVNLSVGMPIKDLSSTSHKVKTTFSGPSAAKIELDKSEVYGSNRDYILRYRLDGEQIQSGLLLYEGEKENFFLLMMQPPKRITNAQIPGREYVFIVDVSGSMYGFPLEISKKLIKNLISNLRTTDRFNVLLFSGGSSLMSEESQPATQENINKAINLIDRQKGGGSTELLPALSRALKLARPEGFSRTIVIATDGYVTVEEEVFDLIRNNLNNANIFAFGIGTSVNRHIIEGMAHVGMGEPFVITRAEDAPAKADSFRTMIQSPVLTRVKAHFNGFTTYDVEPVAIPDVLAERPVILFGKWRGALQGTIALSGLSGNGEYRDTINVSTIKPSKTNAALEYLWARYRITLLSDYNNLRSNDKRIKEITGLGLAYNLLTQYTSFVAVDSEVRNKDGKVVTVKQPLPMPQGVSEYAVGNGQYYGMGGGRSGYASHYAAAKIARLTEYEGKGRQEQFVAKDEGKPKKAVRIGDITVSEGLSKAAVMNALQKYIEEIEKYCSGSSLKGKLLIRLVIRKDGSVKNFAITSSTLKNSDVEKWISTQIMKWQFPPIQNGREAHVTIPFLFGT
ncbi:MAG: trypsin [Syntrophus sp. (in: bacteria)]|nr:trypsin [Syntrophus sp. (in: bacteria)]